MATITFEHVFKRFGDVAALNDLNFAVDDQEFLVLLGPSGSGKSTALRCLAGLEPITEGTIYINDRPVNNLHPKDRDIAMVFQSDALYPHMTVYDNMAFGLRMQAHKGLFGRNKRVEAEIDRRVRETAAALNIDHLLGRRPKTLSGGQQQRVALGRAIVRDPAAFLMDEPLSKLDARLQVQMRAEISKLHQRLKTTFLYVTHNQVEAMTMSTRIAIIHDGVLQQIDTPQTIYDHPANLFVAGFIGSPSMNLFDAHLEQSSSGLIVRGSGFGTLPVPAHKAAALDHAVGMRVYVGIRPEQLHDPHYLPAGVNNQVRLCGSVVVTERMGSEVYVHFERDGNEFVGRFDSRTSVRPGDTSEAVVETEAMHLFDYATEQTLI